MNSSIRPAVLIALLSIASIPGFATTITLVSSTALTNSGSGTTFNIAPDSAWASDLTAPGGTLSHWVSDVSTSIKNVPVGTTVNFTDSFTLIGSPSAYLGWVTVLADDSTSVTLNGHLLQAVNTNQGATCASGPIGCLTTTQLTVVLPSADFVAGSNNLVFGVRQGVANTPFGLDFAGIVTNTPEPATFGVFGFGLIGLSLAAGRARARLTR
jgi:PEP-CTERM motif